MNIAWELLKYHDRPSLGRRRNRHRSIHRVDLAVVGRPKSTNHIVTVEHWCTTLDFLWRNHAALGAKCFRQNLPAGRLGTDFAFTQ